MYDRELSEIKQMIEKYKMSLPKLSIVILGPGKHNTDPYARKCYHKRCQIKAELKDEHKVFFFEQIDEIAQQEDMDAPNPLHWEIILAREEIDVIIAFFVLKASGLQAELDVFSQHQDIAEKMYIFYDDEHYTRGEARHWHVNSILDLIEGCNGKTEPFVENDIDECRLLHKVKNLIEQKRRALSMFPYRKYGGPNNGSHK